MVDNLLSLETVGSPTQWIEYMLSQTKDTGSISHRTKQVKHRQAIAALEKLPNKLCPVRYKHVHYMLS